MTTDLHATEARWFAVRVMPRKEKFVRNRLEREGVECYVPLRDKLFKYASKSGVRQLPLLPSYVFVRIVSDQRITVLRTLYVKYFITLGGQLRQVTTEEIAVLRRLSSDTTVDWSPVEEEELTAGTPVEVISGPLAGVRGHYVKKKSKQIFYISLGGLGSCLSTCEIDARILVPLGAPGADAER